MNRSLHRLFLVLASAFGLLIVMLGWWQVVVAETLRDRPGNVQTLQAERLIDRGRILSADGRVLAASRAVRVRGRRLYERVYPHGSRAAHAVGYSTADRGRTGVEGAYNSYLSGSFGTEPLLQRFNLKEKRGADVELSLDTRLQRVAERALAGRARAVSVVSRAEADVYDSFTQVGAATVATNGVDLDDSFQLLFSHPGIKGTVKTQEVGGKP
ncbi:MAG: hypothetical protein ABL982_25945, partial [Vicinamibacterales bacterium]